MFKKVLIASAMLVSVVSANAIGFGVSGLITPAPCAITMTGGGVGAYGTLSTPTVQAYGQGFAGLYDMGQRTFDYAVSCSAPTKVAFAFTDAHAGKATPADGNDPVRYGLVDGPSGTVSIGHYELLVQSALLDGVAANNTLGRVTGGSTWSLVGPSNIPANYSAPGWSMGFIKAAGTTTPDTVTNITGTMQFNTRVSKAYVDSATSAITLNGAGTMTVVYL